MNRAVRKAQETRLPLLVLASESSARKRLLKKLGHQFLTHPAHLDEKSFERRISDPRRLVQTLAHEKARVVLASFPNAVVIGSDQMLVLGDQVFGKPLTVRGAIRQLTAMSGQSLQLLTAVSVQSARSKSRYIHTTRMKVRTLTLQEIKAYVHLDQPLSCSGSFKFESFGIALFDRVATSDPSAIEGLPLMFLNKALKLQGFARPRFGQPKI